MKLSRVLARPVLRTRCRDAARLLRLSAVTLLLIHALAGAAAVRAQGAAAAARTAGGPSATATPRPGDAARVRSGEAGGESRPPNAAGSIEGRIVDEGGQPIPNAPVSIALRGASSVQRMSSSASTDEEGKFRIDDLEPGVYSIWSSVPGYVLESDPYRSDPKYYRVGDVVNLRMTKGGVITGTVTNQNGDPVVAARASALIVRELDGTPPRVGQTVRGFRDFQTDDRGVYRIYGLDPGIYVVSVGGVSQFSYVAPGAYDGDAPTYFPSSTRDTAAEVTVRAGQETASVDIRYRGERGHSISGTLAGAIESSADFGGINLSLTHAQSGAVSGNAFVSGRDEERAFSFDGLGDGDYDLAARKLERDGSATASQPQRVSVRGADVTGLKITLAPLAFVRGTVVFEPLRESERAGSGGCAGPPQNLLPQETLIVARRADPDAPKDRPRSRVIRAEAAPNAQGAFTLRNLDAGPFRIEARPLNEGWYLRAVSLPSTAAAATPRTAGRPNAPRVSRPGRNAATTPAPPPSRELLVVASGQQLSGLSVILAEGAASVRGRVVGPEGDDATSLPWRLRVHLVPAERAAPDDVLRFAESLVDSDGTFVLTNLAPGRYLVLARAAAREQETPDTSTRPLAWDAAARARLRREAEAAGLALDLRPCQREQNFTLRYTGAGK